MFDDDKVIYNSILEQLAGQEHSSYTDKIQLIDNVQTYKTKMQQISAQILDLEANLVQLTEFNNVHKVETEHSAKTAELAAVNATIYAKFNRATTAVRSQLKAGLDACKILINPETANLQLYQADRSSLSMAQHYVAITNSLAEHIIPDLNQRIDRLRHQATAFEKLIATINAKISTTFSSTKQWKNELLDVVMQDPLKSSCKSFSANYSINRQLSTSNRFFNQEDQAKHRAMSLGTTFASNKASKSTSSQMCVDADYSVPGIGATTDGLGHPKDPIMLKAIGRAAYFTAKNLVRVAEGYTSANELYQDLDYVFKTAGRLSMSKTTAGTDALAAGVLTRAFRNRNSDKVSVVTGGLGDCIAVAWEPSKGKVTTLAQARQYYQMFQYSPQGVTANFPETKLSRSSHEFDADVVIMRLSDGAWESLPHTIKECELEGQKYFEIDVDHVAFANIMNKAANSRQASSCRDNLQAAVMAEVELQRQQLLESTKAVQAVLAKYAKGHDIASAKLNDLISYATDNNGELPKLKAYLDNQQFDLKQANIMPLEVLASALTAELKVGDDVTISVQTYEVEELPLAEPSSYQCLANSCTIS